MSWNRTALGVASMAMALLSLLAAQALGQAAVMTDKPLYASGESVMISGFGWDPGEPISISVREDSTGTPAVIGPLADDSGSFTTSEFLVPEGVGPTYFTIECQGQISGIAALALFAAQPPLSPQPIVSTDKIDYAPGEVVRITGRNWAPGEQVFMSISEAPEQHSPTSLNAVADESGTFEHFDFVIAEDDVGVQFTLDAVGLTSGSSAQALFTDGFLESPPLFLAKWGTCGSGDQQMQSPYAAAVDGSGNVYVADYSNNRILKFNSSGGYITKWGVYGTGDGQFRRPMGIAVDAQGNVYVADTDNNRIQKFTGGGVYVTKWGSSGSANGYFNSPRGITVGPTGIIYVVDAFNYRVQLFTQSGSYYGKWGSQGSGDYQFSLPWGIDTDGAGDVYIADYSSNQIKKYSMYGVFRTKWGSTGSGEGMFNRPIAVATDAAGRVYVADYQNHRVQKFTGTGTFLTMWGSYGANDGQFQYPADIACGASGRIYVVDRSNCRIQVFGPPPTGGVVGFVRATCPNPGSGVPGVPVAAYKDGPGQTFVRGTTTGASGYYQLSDLLAGNYWIRVVPPSHLVAGANDVLVTVSPGADTPANFELLDIAGPVPALPQLPEVVGECSAAIDAPPTANDLCSGVVIGTTNDPLTYLTQGTFTVRWTYVDASGNHSEQDQHVIVRDTTAPSIQAPGSVPAVAGNGPFACFAFVSDEELGSPTASDNCAGGVAITRSPLPEGNLFPVGTTAITWTATDAAGNSASATQEVRVTAAPGMVAGRVLADCPSPGTGLIGVHVDIFDSLGAQIAATVTDGAGAYEIGPLASRQPLTVTVVTPLGYLASIEDMAARIQCGETVNVDFSLNCIAIVANPRSSGFWKHQVGVATGGPGNGQVDGPTLCSHLDMIDSHFNGNALNQVVVYEPPPSGTCADKLGVAKALLNLRGNVGMTARARQQLMSLLLNVAAGYIGQQQVVSEDGATLSQAITYCDELIDGPASGHELAKTIADMINNNLSVAAGVIPLSTQNISYRRHAGVAVTGLGQNLPNPFQGETTIAYALSRAGEVRVTVFDVSGRVVRVLAEGATGAGQHLVRWDGTDGSGERLAPGVYFYRLEAREDRERAMRTYDQKKMMVLR